MRKRWTWPRSWSKIGWPTASTAVTTSYSPNRGKRPPGYLCYGPIAGTAGSYDLYWIAVDANVQRQGLGKVLLAESERLIRQEGGKRVYVETSNRGHYASTRAFYERSGYTLEALTPPATIRPFT